MTNYFPLVTFDIVQSHNLSIPMATFCHLKFWATLCCFLHFYLTQILTYFLAWILHAFLRLCMRHDNNNTSSYLAPTSLPMWLYLGYWVAIDGDQSWIYWNLSSSLFGVRATTSASTRIDVSFCSICCHVNVSYQVLLQFVYSNRYKP